MRPHCPSCVCDLTKRAHWPAFHLLRGRHAESAPEPAAVPLSAVTPAAAAVTPAAAAVTPGDTAAADIADALNSTARASAAKTAGDSQPVVDVPELPAAVVPDSRKADVPVVAQEDAGVPDSAGTGNS
jgi:hypothetical protein